MALHYQRFKRDYILLFVTRIFRMIGYGMLAIVFFSNLFLKGITEFQASWIQTGIVAGDIFISLFLTTRADKLGRINTLMFGALLKLITGLIYAESQNIHILLVTGIFGVISVTGGQIGPFMPIEQSALTELIEKSSDSAEEVPKNISQVFGYYNMAGYLSQATGAALAGLIVQYYTDSYGAEYDGITNVVRLYALLGGLCFACYFMMKPDNIEPEHAQIKVAVNCAGLEASSVKTVTGLVILFMMDAWGGAFIVQSYLAFYYQEKYGLDFSKIGAYLFICNIISGISGILSSKIVACIGPLATMIYTHLPSNLFLIAIALVNDPTASILLLMGRFCISQMDVPARQAFVTLIVSKNERSAANGITNVARSVGLALGLIWNGYFMTANTDSLSFSVPFLIAGGTKIAYDLLIGFFFLWCQKKEEEQAHADSFQISQSNVTEMQDEPIHVK